MIFRRRSGGRRQLSKPKTLLVDADIVVYQASCRNELNYDWGDDVKSQVTDLESAKEDIDKQLGKLLEVTNCKDLILCFTSNPNFRHKVLSSYKANRKSKPKPVLYNGLHSYCIETYPCKCKPNLEADDVLGVLSTRHPGRYVVASIDKDLDQIPGHHYNWNTEKLYQVGDAEGDHQFYLQCLTGDVTDNYSGCPGIGKVKATKILKDVLDECTPWADTPTLNKSVWTAIVTTYEAKGLTEADALVQARVARILRAKDYDFKLREPKLWSPFNG